MKEIYLHKSWERQGKVRLGTYTATGAQVQAFTVAREDIPNLKMDGLKLISAAGLLKLRRAHIENLLRDRQLTVGQLQCENAKERGWSARRVDQLSRLIELIDVDLKALGYTDNPEKHLMALS